MSDLPAGYKQTEVGVIPEDWEVKKIGEFVKITSGESPSRFMFSDDGTPYFKVEQLNNGNKYLLDTPYHSEFRSTVPKGSLIFPKRGASILLNKIRILVENSFMDTNLIKSKGTFVPNVPKILLGHSVCLRLLAPCNTSCNAQATWS